MFIQKNAIKICKVVSGPVKILKYQLLIKHLFYFSDENNCSQDILESWGQKKEFDNDTAKLGVPLLTETVKRCLKWLTEHRSDVTMKDCDMSLVI